MRGALAFLASVACGNDQAVYTDLGQEYDLHTERPRPTLARWRLTLSSSCSLRCAYTYGPQTVTLWKVCDQSDYGG